MSKNWEKMGFASKEDYNKYLASKMKPMLDKVKNDPRDRDVFKRLYSK